MTLKSDMLLALQDDEYSALKDVTLIGSDGGRVEATKAVLAIRSGVFRRMFFGSFQETDSKEVQMDYSGVVLQVVVRYCYADELDLDLLTADNADHTTDAEAVAMVQVRDAANYLELTNLHKTLSNEIGESILSGAGPEDLGCVCSILEELMARGGRDGPLWATCLDLVQDNPEACFMPKESTHNHGILACSLPLLALLFAFSAVDNPMVYVKALKKWKDEHRDMDETDKAKLQALADSCPLESISPANLAQVEPCELFSMERLYKAFVHHGKIQSPGVAAAASTYFSTPQSTPKSSPFVSTATMRGCGVECANGVYQWRSTFGFYELIGNYGDILSNFRIQRTKNNEEEEEDVWKITVATGAAQHNSCPMVLYEATAPGTDKPPFANWRCVDGKDPTPYVSVLGSVPPVAPTTTTNFLFGEPSPSPTANGNRPALGTANLDQVADAFRAHLAINNPMRAAPTMNSERSNARRRRPRNDNNNNNNQNNNDNNNNNNNHRYNHR